MKKEVETVWSYFEDRKYGAKVSKVRVVARNTGLSRAETNAAFKTLQDAGFGRHVLGRRGHETRFVWHRNPKDINPLAAG